MAKDEAFLKKIRDRYRKAADYWKPIHEEAATDMRYVTGDPWSARDKEERRIANRPALTSDELQQYVNQAINQLRQNKRGIQVKPEGEGSTDETATVQQDLIRSIEYKSVAQQNAYIPAFEDEIQRSYGFFRLTRQYVGDSFRQEILIKGIANPDAVLFDPAVKEADWSDAEYVFVLNPIPKGEFQRKYPKAKVVTFSEDANVRADWIREDVILEAEYWEIEKTSRVKLLIDTDQGPTEVWEDELPVKPAEDKILRSRKVEKKSVTQYITNGIEILEENPQPGTIIPIFAAIGKEMWVPEGGVSKRKIFSLIRLARDPYMMYCWLITQQAEEFKLTPKAPFVGAVGQFKTDKEAWDSASDVPHSYLQYDIVTDESGQQVLPPPSRPQYIPNTQAYEMAKESNRRQIQAALGIAQLPTAAQRANQKSGVALEKIQQEYSVGSFHFTDNFDRALNLCGRCLLEWIPEVYSDEREMQLPQEDGSTRRIRINTDEPYESEEGKPEQHPISEDLEHSVTISTGPSYQSQRDAASDFVEMLVGNLAALPIDPPSKAKLLSLAIKMKDLGPIGDAMAKVISPDDPNAPQMLGQKLQQTGMQLQAMNAYAQQLEQEIQKLNMEKQGKVVDNEFRLKIEELKNQTQITIAEIETKAQQLSERMKWERDAWIETHNSAHELAMQNDQQAHEQDLAQQAAVQQQQQQASDQQFQAQQSSQPSDTGE